MERLIEAMLPAEQGWPSEVLHLRAAQPARGQALQQPYKAN